MLTYLNSLVGTSVEIFIGGKFLTGTLVSVDATNLLFTFDDGSGGVWTGSIASIDLVR